jgi:hypothetical protein
MNIISCYNRSYVTEQYKNKQQLEQLKLYLIYPDVPKWGRLICEWNEKKEDGRTLSHLYAPCVNLEKQGMYIDCRPQKIFAKCLALVAVRPLHAIIKTIYHISLAGVAYQIYNACSGIQTANECLQNSIKSIVDIIRTPLYGLAMTIVTVAALILGAFSPQTLYESRQLLGEIEQAANWGKKHTPWTLAPCFQPFPLNSLKTRYGKYHYTDTLYRNDDAFETGLANFGRASILRRRRVYNLFDQFCCTLDPNRIFVSKILEKHLLQIDKIPKTSSLSCTPKVCYRQPEKNLYN